MRLKRVLNNDNLFVKQIETFDGKRKFGWKRFLRNRKSGKEFNRKTIGGDLNFIQVLKTFVRALLLNFEHFLVLWKRKIVIIIDFI